MRKNNLIYILIGCICIAFSLEARLKNISGCTETIRAKDGEHGAPGYFEDGQNGQNGEDGKNGQDGGHGGNGGSSIYKNGGNGGNGGDAE